MVKISLQKMHTLEWFMILINIRLDTMCETTWSQEKW